MNRLSIPLLPLLALASASFAPGEETVTLCHFPPGNPGERQTIFVGAAAVPAHLAHGDELGSCAAACEGDVEGADPDCPTCGDGIVQTGEECDDGNLNPFDGCDLCRLVDTTPD